MSCHTFGARLYLLRHHVKRLARTNLAGELQKRASRMSLDDGAELMEVSADDIRAWEKEIEEPSVIAKRTTAAAMGFPKELLDPDAEGHAFSPEGFLEIARSKHWGQFEISHFWKIIRERASFSGTPSASDWKHVIEATDHFLPTVSQGALFLDEFWCTHCGHWSSESQIVCPRCGVPD